MTRGAKVARVLWLDTVTGGQRCWRRMCVAHHNVAGSLRVSSLWELRWTSCCVFFVFDFLVRLTLYHQIPNASGRAREKVFG